MSGSQGPQRLEEIKEKNLSLQQERQELLRSIHLPEDYLTEPFVCPYCHDEGYRDGKRCECFEKILKEEPSRRLNSKSPLALCDFSNFDLSYYPEAASGEPSTPEQMAKIFQFCRRYAKTFSSDSSNLLMSGRTGLGKTHLSLSIAKEAMEKGCAVIYGSTPDLLSQIEKERFSHSENDLQTLEFMLECDLLILDDLGAEFSTTFTGATVLPVTEYAVKQAFTYDYQHQFIPSRAVEALRRAGLFPYHRQLYPSIFRRSRYTAKKEQASLS